MNIDERIKRIESMYHIRVPVKITREFNKDRGLEWCLVIDGMCGGKVSYYRNTIEECITSVEIDLNIVNAEECLSAEVDERLKCKHEFYLTYSKSTGDIRSRVCRICELEEFFVYLQ